MSNVLAGDYADAGLVVAEYLGRETGPLYSHVGPRVWVEYVARTFKCLEDALVIRRSGGRPHRSCTVDRARIGVRCYGAGQSVQAAGQLYRLVAADLARARYVVTDSGTLMSAEWSGGGDHVDTPAGVFPYVLAWFTCLVKP